MVAMQQELEALRSQLDGAKQEIIVKEKAAADMAQMHSTMKSEAAEAAARAADAPAPLVPAIPTATATAATSPCMSTEMARKAFYSCIACMSGKT